MQLIIDSFPGIQAINWDSPGLYGFIIYCIIFLMALVIGLIVLIKIKLHNHKILTFVSFLMVYLAAMIVTGAYIIDKIEKVLTIDILDSLQSVIISLVGYTVASIAIYSLILKIINFREKTKKIVTILFYIQSIIMVSLDLALIAINFIGNVPSSIHDIITIILGLFAIGIMIFTIIALSRESSRTASKMTKLRLRLAIIGTVGFLIDGLGNIVNLVLTELQLTDFRYLFIDYIVPSIAIVFYTASIFGFYYALFPPLWLQKFSRIIPISFLKLVQKEKLLKGKAMEAQA